MAVVGYIVTIFGAKEQTYEEAIEAQKKKKDTKKPVKPKNTDFNKKKKWRKSKGDGGADKNDADGEEVVVVPDLREDPEPLPDHTPEPSPLPTPEPKKNKSKQKILIEDVEEVVEDPESVEEAPEAELETVPVEAAAPESPEAEVEAPAAPTPEPVLKATPTKTKTRKQKAEAPVATGTPRDLLAAIQRTCFNDEEAQAVINVLLTKQSGGPLNTSEEWIEPGKPSEAQKLKQELGEANRALEEERNSKIVFEKQLTAMRRDVSAQLAGVKRAAGAEQQRQAQELAAQHTHQLNNLNGRLAEMHNNEMAMRGRLDEVQMEKMHTASQYQAQVDTLSHQLQMAQSHPAPTFNENLTQELEQLRSIRDRYEGQLNDFLLKNKGLEEQLAATEGVKGQLAAAQDKVAQAAAASSSLSAALASAQAENSQLGVAKAAIEVELTRVSGQLEERRAAPAESAGLAAELAAARGLLQQREAEKARLLEENERLAEQVASSVERPAAEGEEANGHRDGEVQATPAGPGQSGDLAGKMEDWREKYDGLYMEHEKLLAKQVVAQADMEGRRADMEGKLEGLAVAKATVEAELTEQKTVLVNSQTRNDELRVDLQAAESALQSKAGAADAAEKLVTAEGQVDHYKTVLAQTENMLNSLQASVESAEAEWRRKLEASTKELVEVRTAHNDLARKAAALEEEVATSDQTEEMAGQVAALQAQLAAQEAEKAELAGEHTALASRAEGLAEEVRQLSAQQEELARGNTGLQAALGVAQDALEKEKGGVAALREQLQGKDEHIGNGTRPSEEALQ